jgi:hypothetical protein
MGPRRSHPRPQPRTDRRHNPTPPLRHPRLRPPRNPTPRTTPPAHRPRPQPRRAHSPAHPAHPPLTRRLPRPRQAWSGVPKPKARLCWLARHPSWLAVIQGNRRPHQPARRRSRSDRPAGATLTLIAGHKSIEAISKWCDTGIPGRSLNGSDRGSSLALGADPARDRTAAVPRATSAAIRSSGPCCRCVPRGLTCWRRSRSTKWCRR